MAKLDAQISITGTNGLTVGNFWAWAYSDILSNRNRGIFAEFLVGSALQVLDAPRIEWYAFDHSYGGKRIEVKSAAYTQSWPQTAPSKIIFGIGGAFVTDANLVISQVERSHSSDCYVFCLYKEKDSSKARENLLNVKFWDFYVLSTEQLNQTFGKQKSLSLTRLQALCDPVKYSELKNAVDEILGLNVGSQPS